MLKAYYKISQLVLLSYEGRTEAGQGDLGVGGIGGDRGGESGN